MIIWVNGIQRSGTNYVFNILKDNTKFEVLDYSSGYWKHDKIEAPSDSSHKLFEFDKMFTIIKNPYTWVESICFRNPVDIVKWFPEYNLRDNKDHLGGFKINLKRLVGLYKNWYIGWMDRSNTTLIQYEKMLDERDIKRWIIENITTDVGNIIIRDKVPQSDNWVPNMREKYMRGELQYLNPTHIKIINEVLGKDFINKIGYSIKYE